MTKQRNRRPRPNARARGPEVEGCHDVPRHPVEHRQRRPARAALHQPPSRPRARRPVGALAPRRREGRGGVGRPAARTACSRPTTSTRCSRSTPTACLHRDRRPAPGGRDHGHGAHPRVGQERRVELGRRGDLSPAPRARSCASRSKTRAQRATSRASRRASIRAGRTTCCRSCSPARASTSTKLRVMEVVNYTTLRAADRAVRHDGLRQGARLEAVAACSPACCRSRGAAW